MTRPVNVQDVLSLPPAERLELVEAIWDSLEQEPRAVPQTEEQRRELDRRLESYRNDPQGGSPWAEVKARILRGR